MSSLCKGVLQVDTVRVWSDLSKSHAPVSTSEIISPDVRQLSGIRESGSWLAFEQYPCAPIRDHTAPQGPIRRIPIAPHPLDRSALPFPSTLQLLALEPGRLQSRPCQCRRLRSAPRLLQLLRARSCNRSAPSILPVAGARELPSQGRGAASSPYPPVQKHPRVVPRSIWVHFCTGGSSRRARHSFGRALLRLGKESPRSTVILMLRRVCL